ncbi:MAG: histidine kinase [Leptospiraceae bacterium]|nr:histidine kinase [Leptospiraceae bacterium]MCP5493680.1 histidine kinase [Leptospiraceae bacterium]
MHQGDNSISIIMYRISKDAEKQLQNSLKSILSDLSKEQFVPLFYTILKELVINACKANQKRVFFEERGYNIFEEQDYSKGIIDYKKSFSEKMSEEYGIKSRKKGYYCLVKIDYHEEGITFCVENNTPIIKQEEESIREKLEKAMQYDDIAQFYMDNSEESEGAGLGLALVVILIKGEGIDPKYFRISNKDGMTIARLEVPFTPEFISKRYN